MENVNLNISDILGMSAHQLPAVIDKILANCWFRFTVSLTIAIITIVLAIGSIVGYYAYHRIKAKQRAKENDKKYPKYAPYNWRSYDYAEPFTPFVIGVAAAIILIICICIIILSLWDIHMWTVNPDGMIYDYILSSIGGK